MSKTLIITAAGMATRFNNNNEKAILKSIYTGNGFDVSILKRLIRQGSCCSEIIIVGGYLFTDLKEYVEQQLKGLNEKIELVYNPYFSERGSMYSLYLGIKKAEEKAPDEIIFAEGDLIVDDESFQVVCDSQSDVVSVNHNLIWSEKAVIAYLDGQNKIHYLFDTAHRMVTFDGCVKAIFNSGQIWKFREINRLIELNERLTEIEKCGTNLILIQNYFKDKSYEDFECIDFQNWYNCNEIKDYVEGMGKVLNK